MTNSSSLFRRPVFVSASVCAFLCFAALPGSAAELTIGLKITSKLTFPNTPMSVTIDFAEKMRQGNHDGVLDANSIRVINRATGRMVPSARTEDFAYSDRGRIEWVIADPKHTAWSIRFRTAGTRPPLRPQGHVPAIGVGDLLRYNAGPRRPITSFFQAELHDLTGDGRPDLVGSWNYAYRDGDPWAAPILYPSIDPGQPTQFGNLQRLRYFEPNSPESILDLHTAYSAVDCVDFNADGHLDLLYLNASTRKARILLGTSRRQPGGAPIFAADLSLSVPRTNTCQAVDLDGDNDLDLVFGRQWLKNNSPTGWPLKLEPPASHGLGESCAFADLDHDGRLDALHRTSLTGDLAGGRLVWRRRLGTDGLKFADPVPLDGVTESDITMASASQVNGRTVLVIQHNAFQHLAIYRQAKPRTEDDRRSPAAPRFERVGRAESPDAVLSLSDQAWPSLCDWENDGDQDLLVGGGYGWPQLVINSGTDARPRYENARRILSDGKPIRLLRNPLLGPPLNGHNMGYPYPVLVDWDADGRRDLFCPNETNRIFWFRNIADRGTAPRFGPRRQVLCDGFPDSPELKMLSATRAASRQSNNGVYPYEPRRPFMWRTGAAVADFNGDTLLDFVTCEGSVLRAALFVQYRDDRGNLKLKRHSVVKLKDGRELTGQVAKRKATWSESFRPVDWNRDGLVDLVYSTGGSHHGTLDGGSMYLLENVGTRTAPLFGPPQTMKCYGRSIRITNHGPHPWIGDYNGDGLPDVIACVEWSVYPFYSHAALMMDRPPDTRLSAAVLVERGDR